MPMGPYKDFGACVRAQRKKGYSKEAAQGVCGLIKKRAEGEELTEDELKKVQSAIAGDWFNDVLITTSKCEDSEEEDSVVEEEEDSDVE